MQIEAMELKDAPRPIDVCPKCDAPFDPFMRGQVQRWPWPWWKLWLPIGKPRPYCALICWHCKEIVGYEKP